MPDSRADHAARMYRQGASTDAVAQALGVHKWTANRLCRAGGAQMRPAHRPNHAEEGVCYSCGYWRKGLNDDTWCPDCAAEA